MQGRRRPRVLWVTEEAPDRALGGGNIRQSHLFRALAPVITTDLLTVGVVRDEEVRALAANLVELPHRRPMQSEHPLGRRAQALAIVLGSRYPAAVHAARVNRRALIREVRARERAYDIVCVEHESLAPVLSGARPNKSIITFHHLLSTMIAEELALAPGRRQRWFRRREVTKAQRLERWALQSYDRCIVCSDEDAVRIESLDGSNARDRVAVIPNGVDLDTLAASPVPQQPRVLLPGTLAWPPNVDGAVWLCAEIWPLVREEVPAATLVLAGRSPVPEVLELERLPGVSVEADVPSMAPYFASARVVVVPLRIGTGTRLKALEAMATGRPIVGTQVGLEGIGIEDGVHACVRDDAEAFAKAITDVLRDDTLATDLGRAARIHVEARFGWERVGRQFVELVSSLVEDTEPSRAALRSSRSVA
jgi:glycosyltransferase involved in cell wall biosynthesis